MGEPRYVICPGFVFAKDGDRHWIGAAQLMRLYGVSPADCVTLGDGLGEGLIPLEPKWNGDYSLPDRPASMMDIRKILAFSERERGWAACDDQADEDEVAPGASNRDFRPR